MGPHRTAPSWSVRLSTVYGITCGEFREGAGRSERCANHGDSGILLVMTDSISLLDM